MPVPKSGEWRCENRVKGKPGPCNKYLGTYAVIGAAILSKPCERCKQLSKKIV